MKSQILRRQNQVNSSIGIQSTVMKNPDTKENYPKWLYILRGLNDVVPLFGLQTNMLAQVSFNSIPRI